jgi:hypothetical protein
MAEEITGLGDDQEDSLNQRIGNAFNARENSGSLWAQQYWDNTLSYLLRKANRCGSTNFHLN